MRPSAAQRGYDKAWQRARARHLANHPRCRVCGDRASDVDHFIPVKVAPHLRLHPGNLVSLCHFHHSHVTNAFDSGRIRGACDSQGNPLDPDHPWATAQGAHRVAGSPSQDSVRRPKAASVLRTLKAEWLDRWSIDEDEM